MPIIEKLDSNPQDSGNVASTSSFHTKQSRIFFFLSKSLTEYASNLPVLNRFDISPEYQNGIKILSVALTYQSSNFQGSESAPTGLIQQSCIDKKDVISQTIENNPLVLKIFPPSLQPNSKSIIPASTMNLAPIKKSKQHFFRTLIIGSSIFIGALGVTSLVYKHGLPDPNHLNALSTVISIVITLRSIKFKDQLFKYFKTVTNTVLADDFNDFQEGERLLKKANFTLFLLRALRALSDAEYFQYYFTQGKFYEKLKCPIQAEKCYEHAKTYISDPKDAFALVRQLVNFKESMRIALKNKEKASIYQVLDSISFSTEIAESQELEKKVSEQLTQALKTLKSGNVSIAYTVFQSIRWEAFLTYAYPQLSVTYYQLKAVFALLGQKIDLNDGLDVKSRFNCGKVYMEQAASHFGDHFPKLEELNKNNTLDSLNSVVEQSLEKNNSGNTSRKNVASITLGSP